MMAGVKWLLVLIVAMGTACRHPPNPAPAATGAPVAANDNRRPAGVVSDGVLRVQLEIREGDWQAEADGATYRILAFAEATGALVNPGPLIRVREGTTVDVTVRSRVKDEIAIHGLYDRSTADRPLRVPGNGTASVRFRTGPAGTYYYWGTRGQPLNDREGTDSQLTGALIVDPAGGAGDDRVFIIGLYVHGPGLYSWVINGRSWPDTERLDSRLGERLRWRWINATGHRHPMHLHGHYFRVTSTGDNARETPSPPDTVAVTQTVQRGHTMTMEWSPQRSGYWLFHCHLLPHVMPENRIPLGSWFEEHATMPHERHMAGLILGLHVEEPPDAASSAATRPARAITLRVGDRAGVQYDADGLKRPGLGYALDRGPITAPGPPIVIERSGDQKADVLALTQAMAIRLQYHVADHPEQWTVFQKRWPAGTARV